MVPPLNPRPPAEPLPRSSFILSLVAEGRGEDEEDEYAIGAEEPNGAEAETETDEEAGGGMNNP